MKKILSIGLVTSLLVISTGCKTEEPAVQPPAEEDTDGEFSSSINVLPAETT
ncbi:hypothetical protein GF366_00390 [Candidatus Peregrinibacteria bacterium]|nr:hypothetical protein [Candidatus Peregrinibacteria bacterium]